jgi:hypothetical protein
VAGRNAEATRRRYQDEAEPDAPIPSARTIRTHFAAIQAGLEILLLAGAGAFDDNPAAGMVRLKAVDIALRAVERGVFPLIPSPPQEARRDWSTLTLEEREAFMRDELQSRKDG